MSTTLTNVKNDKIFDFSSSDSDSQIQAVNIIKNNINSSSQNLTNLNPEGQLSKNQSTFERNYQSQTQLKSHTLTNFHSNKTIRNDNNEIDQKNTEKIYIRRNKSIKLKRKTEKETLNLKKQFSTKSVSKFGNIFNHAEEIQLNGSTILAVHEEQSRHEQKEQKSQIKQAVRTNPFKIQNHVQSNYNSVKPSILKLSSNYNVKNIMRREIDSFESENNIKTKMMRTTMFTEKPMKEYIDKKFSLKLSTERPFTALNEKKINIKVQQILDLKAFVHKKISSSHVLIANLKKDTSGLNFIWPQYHLIDFHSNIHILSGKKKSANTTSNYYISRNQKNIDVQNDFYMGKIRANFLGSCFNIFNQGVNPQSGAKGLDQIRKLLATVIYQGQITNANPKTIRVYMIKHPYSYYQLEGTNIKEEQTSLEQLYQIGQNKHKISLLKNRKPTYNKKQNKFVLNFGGRIKKPSTKNFILEDTQTKKQVMMLGKLDDDQYILHLSSPLTPHLGMGIALAEMDNKIICD